MDGTPTDSPSFLQSIPRVTRIIAIFLGVATAIVHLNGVGDAFVNNFALKPMSTIAASKVWNVVTGGFVELNPIKSIVNIILFLATGKWIETSWGGKLFFVFVILVNTVAGISTYLVMFAAFVATRIENLFFTPIGTTNGICVALLIAVKQLIPEHEIGFSGMNISANYLPLVYITLITILTFAGRIPIGELVFTISAFQFSWLYLRYYQRKNVVRGDQSESFGYATMFPEPLRRVVAIFANFGFVMFRPVLMAGQGSQVEPESAQEAPMSKASSIDAERRRQRALRALDERMNSAAKTEDTGESPV